MAARDEFFYVRVMPDCSVRICDGKNWYESFDEFLDAEAQRIFEADLWREAGRKPDAVMTVTTHGKTKETEIYHS